MYFYSSEAIAELGCLRGERVARVRATWLWRCGALLQRSFTSDEIWSERSAPSRVGAGGICRRVSDESSRRNDFIIYNDFYARKGRKLYVQRLIHANPGLFRWNKSAISAFHYCLALLSPIHLFAACLRLQPLYLYFFYTAHHSLQAHNRVGFIS